MRHRRCRTEIRRFGFRWDSRSELKTLLILLIFILGYGVSILIHYDVTSTTTSVVAIQKPNLTLAIQLPSSFQHSLCVVFRNRLGNLMFEFASGFGIARHNSFKSTLLCSDPSQKRLVETFPEIAVAIPCAGNLSTYTPLHLKRWGIFDPSTMLLKNNNQSYVLRGFMQSYKYFWDYRDAVRKLFIFSVALRNSAEQLLHRLIQNSTNHHVTVGVHVRRGDYTKIKNSGYNIPNASYFEAALNHFRRKFRRPLFIVVSEDIHWCRDNIKGRDVVYGSSGKPTIDMCMLTMTNHIIISVGTYGWWSAFLNRGHVVYYRNIAKPGSKYARDYEEMDYFPTEWTGM